MTTPACPSYAGYQPIGVILVTARIKRAALAHGLACYPGGGTVDGVHGDHVVLAPPYVISPDEIELVVDRLDGAIADALSSLPGRAAA